jgi:hypothetical protein
VDTAAALQLREQHHYSLLQNLCVLLLAAALVLWLRVCTALLPAVGEHLHWLCAAAVSTRALQHRVRQMRELCGCVNGSAARLLALCCVIGLQ